MSTERNELHSKLKALVPNVYFQPPKSVMLKYPCIVYNIEAYPVVYADDDKYSIRNRYAVTVIYNDPDSKLPKDILKSFRFCSHDQHFVVDNLYHDVFTLFY